MFDFLKRKNKVHKEANVDLKVDFHSHLIPGIDDGVKTIDDAVDVIAELSRQGIEKIITTPHVISDLYPNTSEIIRNGEQDVKKAILEWKIPIEFVASAEYYLDEWFIDYYENKASDLLLFADKHLLFETNYVERPHYLEQSIFDLKIAGYKPILAHPERYHYLLHDFKLFEKLYDSGVLFQMNLLSLSGHYGPQVKKAAEFMIKEKMVDAVGSDIHKIQHAKILRNLKHRESYYRLMELPLINNSL